MRSSDNPRHPANGLETVASDLSYVMAGEAAKRWMRGWHELPVQQRPEGWEPFELLEVQPLTPIEGLGIPVALVRGHHTATEMVLFFGPGAVSSTYTVTSLTPAEIDFDVSAFRPARMTGPPRCEHHWRQILPNIWHVQHTCIQENGHDQGEDPTEHVCSCGTTLPPTGHPV